jgi:hypothetical protein
VAGGVGKPADSIRFADIDGDGRADYLALNNDSSIEGWFNGGPKSDSGRDDPERNEYLWWAQGTVASGVDVPSSQIRLADINGDHKADYLAVDPATGNTRMWRNAGRAGSSWGWSPQGSITVGNSSRIVYADISGDNRAEYLQTNADSSVQAWLNSGPKAEGGDWIWLPQFTIASGVNANGNNVRFTDLNGDNRADYVVVNADGSMQAWLNGGPKNAGGGDWNWFSQGTIAGGVGAPGSSVRLADLNNDDRADYVVVHPSSRVEAWLNGGPKSSGGDWIWAPQGTIAGGVGAAGDEVRFADLTGDHREDYLDVNPVNGSTRAWLNTA